MSRLTCAVLCLLLWSGPARTCDLVRYQHQAPVPISLAAILGPAWPEPDLSRCREACCNASACDLVLVGSPSDGVRHCQLMSCRDPDRCRLWPNPQFTVFRKEARRDRQGPHAVPLMGVPIPETPETPETQRVLNESSHVLCRLPMKVGKCRAAFPRFYYDSTNQSCRRFTFGGCDANGNNFNTREECEATCSGVTGSVLPVDSTPAPPEKSARKSPALEPRPSDDDDVSSEYKALCLVPPEAGACRAAFPMFFFDAHTSTCQTFTYGGCRGNKNRYSTKEECEQVCINNGRFDGRGKPRNRLTAAIFLFITLASVSALLLAALIVITLRRHRLSGRTSSVSDKEELLPDPDDSLSIPESPTPPQA